MAADPDGKTNLNTCSGNAINVSEKIPPSMLQRKMLCVYRRKKMMRLTEEGT
jgi:hypothetical protein